MIQPVELKKTLPMKLHDGIVSTTTEVWDMLVASRDGDLDRVKELTSRCPALITCQYNYTPPLHFAVREGHLPLARYLVERGALDPTYVSYPFKDSLLTMAQDRGHNEIEQLLTESLSNPKLARVIGDTGEIDYGKDETQRQFQEAVNRNRLRDVKRLLAAHHELARDDTTSWGEGVLMMPANRGNREMLELLMRYGARVPDVSKWGRAYYFKRYDIAAFLMENGMNPDHMTWLRVTLLHDMAQEGAIPKARLLLDHGADINPVDEEYQSTPLGLAARWGQREMVAFLIERGADPNTAGAPWATPIAWARKKGHNDIEADLRRSGAQ
jgi:ankyrin repeat protein